MTEPAKNSGDKGGEVASDAQRSRGPRRWAVPRRRPRPLIRLARATVWAGATFAIFAAGLILAAAVLNGRPLIVPVWAVAEAEARLNSALGGQAVVSLGGAEIVFGTDGVPRVQLDDLRLGAPDGRQLARLPDLRASFAPMALLTGALRPVEITLSGPRLTLRRRADGTLDLSFGEDLAAADGVVTPAAVLAALDAAFALPVLSELRTIEAQAATLTLDDRRADRIWTVGDGRVTLARGEAEFALNAGFGLVGAGGVPARAQVTVVAERRGGAARLSATIDQVAASDLAVQDPALGWLGVIDAPISGDLRAAFAPGGDLAAIEGALQFSAGALRPFPTTPPIAFESAAITFAYDPAAQRIAFDDLVIDSTSLRLAASGQSYLVDLADGVPGAFLGQVRIGEIALDPEGLFEAPMRFSTGALDLRLRLNPFSLEIGQLALVEEGHRLHASGRISADAAGWSVALDMALDEIRHDRLFALWPLALVPGTRAWLVSNVQQGLLFDVRAALRVVPGADPVLSVGYEYGDTDVRLLRTLPPVEAAHGHAMLENNAYTLVLDKGRVTPPSGGPIDVAGSVFRVADVTAKPGIGDITLRSRSSVTAAMSLLDQPPFQFLSRAGFAVDLAQGRADLTTRLRMPLMDRLSLDQVQFEVEGTLHDLSTDRMAPGQTITAPRMRLVADRSGVAISGAGKIGEVPFDAVWRQPFGPHGAGSVLTGSLAFGLPFVRAFAPGFAADVISGTGTAEFEIAKGGDGPAGFRLWSDLNRVGVRLDALGWTKPVGAPGLLEISGRLGAVPEIDAFLLRGPGLMAQGKLVLGSGGSLERLSLDRLSLGDWLDAELELAGNDIRITGGSADLRGFATGAGGGAGDGAGAGAGGGFATGAVGGSGLGGGSGGAARPISVALDAVRVTNGISLAGFRGAFGTRGGLNGRFTAQLNGQAPITGQMETSNGGAAFLITSDSGGEVLAAAGLFDKARGGRMEMTLAPTGAPGTYDGAITLDNFRVREMPVLAELLNAVSIVGLLDQMTTSGLLFNAASARLRLTPDGVTIRDGSAVGASFGVTLEGGYDFAADRLNMRGVISPFYILNGIGSILTRPGEGVFGFNYRISGPAARPKVNVNPLSVLAPGFLRGIFQAGDDTARQPSPLPEPPSR